MIGARMYMCNMTNCGGTYVVLAEDRPTPSGMIYQLLKCDRCSHTTESSLQPKVPAQRLSETKLTPALEARARQLRDKPHDSELLIVALYNELEAARKALKSLLTSIGADGADDETAARMYAQAKRIDELLTKNTELHNRHVDDQNDLRAARMTLRAVEKQRDEIAELYAKREACG